MKNCHWLVLVIALSVLLSLPALAQQTPAKPASGTAKASQSSAGKAQPPSHPITLEQTKELFALMHFRETMAQMLHANLEEQRTRAPFIPEDVWQDFETSFAKADFTTVFLPVYQKYLSEEDAARSLEFYRTPAGQRMLEVMPALMQDIAAAAGAKGDAIAQEVFERHHQEIEDAQKKFDRAQPAPSSNQPK